MKQKNIEAEVAQTMASLDGLTKQKAPMDFAAKLDQHLSFMDSKNNLWLRKLQVGIAAMLILSLCNIYFILNSSTTEDSELATRADFEEAYFNTNTLIAYDDE